MTHPTDTQRQDDAAKIVYVVSKQTQFIVVETVQHVWHCPCAWDGYVGEGNVGCTPRADAGHDGEFPAMRVDPLPFCNMGNIACSVGDSSSNTDANAKNNETCTTNSNQPVEFQVGESEDTGDSKQTDPRETTAPAPKTISTRRSKLSSKRRRRRASKAQNKLQGIMDDNLLDTLRLEADDRADVFLANQGLSIGSPVKEYLRLLVKVHFWARKHGVEPVEALEDIENWRVRSLDAHPATVEFKELDELANSPSPFEMALKHLAPQIVENSDHDQEEAEDKAGFVIADLYSFMFTYWDGSAGYFSRIDDCHESTGYCSEKEYQLGENENVGDCKEKDPRETSAPASNIISSRRSKLSSKRRRRKACKAHMKLQGTLGKQLLDPRRLETDDCVEVFLANQGLYTGYPVKKYVRLLKKVHYWARNHGVEPVDALDDIENLRVRYLDAHPATDEFKELLELANSPSPFKKALIYLAPQISENNVCKLEEAENEASLVIAGLRTCMFTYWDDSIGNSSKSDSDVSSGYRSENDFSPT